MAGEDGGVPAAVDAPDDCDCAAAAKEKTNKAAAPRTPRQRPALG